MNIYIENLLSPADQVFLKTLSQLPSDARLKGNEGALFAVSFAQEMMKKVGLHPRVQAERLGAVIQKLKLDVTGTSKLASNSRELSPALKNAVATFLSQSQRRLLYGQTLSGPTENTLHLGAVYPEPDIEVSVVSGIITEDNSGDNSECSTVILLSKIANQESNKQLLNKNDFSPLHYDRMEKLREDLKSNSDVCACLVDGSFMREMQKTEQCQFIEELSEYSTFIWLRIDESGLLITQEEVREIIRRTRCQTAVIASELSIQSDGALRQREISELRHAQKLIKNHPDIQMVPGEISEGQSRILIAAAREYTRNLKFGVEPKILKLLTKFLPGGRSGAKIASVGITPEGQYVVAKIDDKPSIINEIRRFRLFIQQWDNKLQPKASFHGNAAVILFGLVSDGVNISVPAPMLEQCLEDLWNREIFGPDDDSLKMTESNLGVGLTNMAKMLSELNKKDPPTSCEFGPASLGMEYFKKMESQSITWGFTDLHRQMRDKAELQYNIRSSSAIVHGDLQLRNILVHNDLNMHLIDYAGSGPGHPAIDLVRLELALYVGCFKQLEGELEYIQLQEELSLQLLSYDELKAKHQESFRCAINRICMRGCLAARDSAMDTVKARGGNEKDYLAVKYLVAWQNLIMGGRQASLARSVIAAIAPAIDAW